jgi:hypothetical protein
MMWVIFARAPPPDAAVWPGRRALALVDAVVWPAAWAALVLGLPVSSELAGLFALALCAVSALTRAHRAIAHNHRYHFTTWRWGRRLVFVLAFGYALKLAVLLSA